jgi:macrolide transport system ATP-binding/permease protein
MASALMEVLLKDLRFAARQLRKNPVFAVTAIFVLALGMCASLAIFAFTDAVLIQPLPYRNPGRLAAVYETNVTFPRSNLSYPDYLDWKERNRVFDSLDIYQPTGFLLATPSGAQPARGARVSSGFFRTLGVAPILGRDFLRGEDLPSAPHNALLSYAVWQQRYSGRSDVLGQVVTLDGFPHVIIGVLPRDFYFAPAGGVEFWTALQPFYPCDLRRSCHGLWGVARLRDGVSLQAAIANVKAIAKDLEKQYPDSNRDQGADLTPMAEAVVGNVRPILLVLLSGAGLLLLIAAVNVAGLLLVRSESRQREIAVRAALGASSGRLISQFIREALVLTAAASALGLASAYWTIQLLRKLVSQDLLARMPFLKGLGLNGRVLAAAGAIALSAVALLALAPGLRLWSSGLRARLAEAGRGSAGTVWRRLGSKLVIVELVIATVLLTGAGLLGKSLYLLLRVYLGIEPDHLITMTIVAPRAVYGNDSRANELARQVAAQAKNLPGVISVGVASNGVPLTGNGNTTWVHVAGRPWHGEHYNVAQRAVSTGYFRTLGATLLRGRHFNETDDISKPRVAIINRAFETQYFPNEDPLGKQLILHRTPPVNIQIVGIVDDIREGPLDEAIPPVLYFPFEQVPDSYFAIVVRAAGSERQLLPAAAAMVRNIDPGIVPRDGMTMSARIQESESAYLHRSLAWLVGGFAGLALLLSTVGLYGLVAYSVSQRNREIGIRIALGARPGSIYGLILKEGGRLITLGTVFGLACAIAAGGLMRGLLFGVRSWDAMTLVAVAGVLILAAILASVIPARRAASVDPVESLRAE